MTDEKPIELIEARKLLAFLSGWCRGWADVRSDDPELVSALTHRREEIDAFLKRPLFQDQEAA